MSPVKRAHSPSPTKRRPHGTQVHEFKLATDKRAKNRVEGSPSPEGRARMQAM